MKVQHMEIKDKMSVLELIEEMGKSGVLGAGRVSRATRLLADAMEDEDATVFLAMAGPLVPGGLRKIISDLIADGFLDVLITTGANITHDLLEAFGGGHYQVFKKYDDERLYKMGIGRVSDFYTKSEDFLTFEKRIAEILDKITKKRKTFSIRELLSEIGNIIDDKDSILKVAAKKNVPIYSPGLIDSMLGLQLWMYTQTEDLFLDAIRDMHELSDIVQRSKKVAAMILGGGLPKHYVLASNLLRGGVDMALQIIMDRSETGSLSGAPLEEAKSWAKAKPGANLVTVIGDATILFPLMVAGAREMIHRR